MDEVLYCECPCHCGPVPCDDAIGAATACRRCVNAHFPALKDYLYDKPKDPRERIEPTAWNPEDEKKDETGGN